MAAAKTTPLQLVPVGRAHQPANLQLEYTAEYLAGESFPAIPGLAGPAKAYQSEAPFQQSSA